MFANGITLFADLPLQKIAVAAGMKGSSRFAKYRGVRIGNGKGKYRLLSIHDVKYLHLDHRVRMKYDIQYEDIYYIPILSFKLGPTFVFLYCNLYTYRVKFNSYFVD